MHFAVSVGPSQIFLNCKRFSQYGPCPTVRDCLAVYPALVFFVRKDKIENSKFRAIVCNVIIMLNYDFISQRKRDLTGFFV